MYLERLKQITHIQHFNPPSGMNISKSAKTTVQFTVDRSKHYGHYAQAFFRERRVGSSSMRAIQVSKVPELPPNYRAPCARCTFNFCRTDAARSAGCEGALWFRIKLLPC